MTLSTQWKRRGLALALGTVGGALFFAFKFPLAWLLGSLSACLIATLLGVKLQGPGLAVPVLRVVLGLAIGAAFTPALFGRLGEIALSLALIPPFVVVIGSVGYFFYRKVGGYDRATAFYAAMPGGFQDMMAMGEDRGANITTLGLIHSTRVVVLVFMLPFLINWLGGLDLGERSSILIGVWPDAKGILILFACGAAGWWIAAKLGISGAAVIGPMALSAIVHLAGITEARPPMGLINMAQLVIGIYVGCQYQGSTLRQIVRVVGLSLGFMLVLLAIAAAFAALVYVLTSVDPMAILLAYAPGGQGEMNIIALVLDIDVAYVALHHLFRVMLVIIGASIVFRYVKKVD